MFEKKIAKEARLEEMSSKDIKKVGGGGNDFTLSGCSRSQPVCENLHIDD